MKKFILLALAGALLSTGAAASEWYLSYFNEDKSVNYVRTDKVKRSENRVTTWSASAYLKDRTIPYTKITYDLILTYEEVDCEAKTWASLQGLTYLKGKVVNEWIETNPEHRRPFEEQGKEFIKVVCGKKPKDVFRVNDPVRLVELTREAVTYAKRSLHGAPAPF